MTNLFISIVNLSITASWLILAVLVLRKIFNKAPKSIFLCFWAMVGFKLICPYSFETSYSLIPSTETLSKYSNAFVGVVDSGIHFIDENINPIASKTIQFAHQETTIMEVFIFVGTLLWIVGMAFMLIHSILSYEQLQRKTDISLCLMDNVYMCDYIVSPFILGMFNPKIYLPSDMDEGFIPSVLAHEKTHIKRKDYIWKMFGYILLSIHWYNPLVWIAYIAFTYDLESSCDEISVKDMDVGAKKMYCMALVSLHSKSDVLFTYPLAFGEIKAKQRIKEIVKCKEIPFKVISSLVVCGFLICVSFVGNPLSYDLEITYEDQQYTYKTSELNFRYPQYYQCTYQNKSDASFYGNIVLMWEVFEDMGIYVFNEKIPYGVDGIVLVSSNGMEHAISYNEDEYLINSIINDYIYKEEDQSLTYIHFDHWNNKVLSKVKNLKEIRLIRNV